MQETRNSGISEVCRQVGISTHVAVRENLPSLCGIGMLAEGSEFLTVKGQTEE